MNEIINSTIVYEGKIINVEKKQLKLPDNRIVERDYVDHKPAVAMLATINNKIILVSQYRIGSNTDMIEIPAGLIENGENPKECANRELQEETGYKANTTELLGEYYLSPGYSNEKIYIFLCSDLVQSKLPLDDDEFINVTYLDVNEIPSFLKSNKCKDIKTALALSLYQNKTSRK